MRRLPFAFARHAPNIAKGNPAAFGSTDDALDALRRCYVTLMSGVNTTAVSTGGFRFTKDEDGDVELWVSPDVIWAKSDG